MAIGMRKKRKGLFGSQMPAQPQAEPMMAAMPAGQGFAAPAAPQQGGPSFKTVAGNLLGRIGDGMSQWAGMSPIFGEQQQQQQQQQQRMEILAARQRQQSMLQAQRAADAQSLYDHKLANPAPTARQNDVNWYNSLDPDQRNAVNTALDVISPITTTTWQGPTTLPRTPAIGSTMSMDDFMGAGGGVQQQQPDMSGIDSGAYPFSAGSGPVMNQEQFAGIIRAKGGRAAAEKWARDNGIKVVK